MKKRIELHAKTKYSIDHESTLDIKNLILECASNGEKGVAIVDSDSVISFYKAEKILKELNIKDFKLIYGIELNAIYNKIIYKVVVLLKNKNGVLPLFRILSSYSTNKTVFLEELLNKRKNFVIGLIYNKDNYDFNILNLFDYIEVDKSVSKNNINKLKKDYTVIYSNKINALSNDEELSKKVLYNKLNIKKEVQNRIYQSTEEILKELNDKEIVIDNSNKIFDMIENNELVNDEYIFPKNDDFGIDLLVYLKLNETYKDNIPLKIRKRVEEELKLIHEFNYDGYINLYRKIIDKCKSDNEEYIILDYINYLYIAYLLDITHFNPIKLDLNYDIFFSHKASISLKLSEDYNYKLSSYINNNLNIKTIKCKGLMNLKDNNIKKEIEKYEKESNIKLTNEERKTILKHLKDYPINNHAIFQKELIIPNELNFHQVFPRELIKNGNSYYMSTNIDYKDIEDKFITLELLSIDNVTYLNELKDITNDNINNCDYKDKNIIENDDFKNYIKTYDKEIILDDLYNDLIDNNIELPIIFSIINEIRKNKKISKNIRKILDNNNIKLKKYNNINLINRGFLIEKTRLEYELLYFKVYYPLEYYYVMIKDCPLNIIEFIKKGYDEVINKINDTSIDSYEKKYLKLVNEIYESDINFSIEKRFIVEDYAFELDKENNKIVLIINKANIEINKYLNNNISLIGTRPLNGKMEYLSKIIHRLLDKNKSVTLFGLGGPINFYIEYLLNYITGIDRNIIRQYLNPCSCYKDKVLSINEEDYMYGIKYLLYHNLTIKDYFNIDVSIIEKCKTFTEKLIYMIKESESDVVIIDDIKSIGNDLEILLDNLKIISKEYNIKFIIFTNLKKEYEIDNKKDISSFEKSELLLKYSDSISILDKENLYVIKDI